MKVCVLGSTGMLGSAVGRYFVEKYGEDNVLLTYRDVRVAWGKLRMSFDPLMDDMGHTLHRIKGSGFENVINCIGTIKPFMKNNVANAIRLNSLFPRDLAAYYAGSNVKVFQITTDCVFSGKDGPYTEESPHDALDDYGKTKSLGEPEDIMVLRTSIIGEELHKNASLIAWVKSEAGNQINGYTNHLWNGVTTSQYAAVVGQILERDLYQKGVHHIFSDDVDKFQLVSLINDRFELGCDIRAIEAPQACDRRLATVRSLNEELDIPDLAEQIRNL